ncbi:peptidoglycan-binding protein, partial [Virgibacillus sp. C22-A2]|nr:peptidoglycan-binding protein [Virgibacillus sp. C22-A2]
ASVFQQGERHPGIIDLKENLNRLGFGYISVTTLYGSYTEKKVKDFQEYYGLNVTGKVDTATFNKIDQILDSPFQVGKRYENTIDLKNKLNHIGFGNILVTDLYGDFTELKVREFQKYYGLIVNGIADDHTIEKLSSIANTPFQNGKRHSNTILLKENLNQLGFGNITISTLYGNFTEEKVTEFQNYFGLIPNGIADDRTFKKIDELLSSPFQQGKRHKATLQLKKNLNAIGYGGITLSDFYGSFTEQRVKEFQRDNRLPVSGIADEITRKEIEKRIVRIFLDPGHGDQDSGGQGYGLKEKNVVLDIALRTANALTNNYFGVTVNLSRKTDEFIELLDRARSANNWGADYFVSLHTNAYNGNTNGFETFIHDGSVSQETLKRQKDIHQYLISKLGISDRGMKEADFNVLRNTNMPAILIEYMFIDDFVENALLRDPHYRNWLGEITAEALAFSFNLKRR